MFLKPTPPSKQHINNLTQYHPKKTKRSKNEAPQYNRHRAVQKEVLRRLPTAATQATPPYQCIPPPHKVITSEDPLLRRCPNKERDPPWGFDTPQLRIFIEHKRII